VFLYLGLILAGEILKNLQSNKTVIALAILVGILSFITFSFVFVIYYSLFLSVGYMEFTFDSLKIDLILIMGFGSLFSSPVIFIGGGLSGYILNMNILNRESS